MDKSEPEIVVFVSGLEMSSADPFFAMKAQLLADFVTGGIYSQEHGGISACIRKVIFAGNSIAQSEPQGKDRFSTKLGSQPSENAKQLDSILCQILPVCSVDLIPGPSDPVNFLLPQQVLQSVIA